MSFNFSLKTLFINIALLNLVHSFDCTSLSTCDSTCEDQGYFTDTDTNSCKKPSLSDCINKTGYSLCSDLAKFCIADYGLTSSSTDCIFPTDCDSNSVGCSLACQAIAYTGSSTCKPQDDSYCQNNINKACTYTSSICMTSNGWLQGANGICTLPDCTQSSACLQSSCIYMGYIKDTSTSNCIIPTVDQCLESNTYRCRYSNSPCVNTNILTTGTNGACDLPASCLSPSTSCSPACEYLKYVTNGSKCENPTHIQCLLQSQNNCGNSLSACITQLGWVADVNKDCTYPTNCFSNSVDCAESCKYLNFISGGTKCSYPSHEFCLTNGQNYCQTAGNACSLLGWVKKALNDYQCDAPTDCLTSCDSEACKYLGYIKESGVCRLRKADECLATGQYLCAVDNHSACIKIGYVKNNNDCEYPSNCLSGSSPCSAACEYLKYTTNGSKCEYPTHSFCLTNGQNYCFNSLSACEQLGWVQKAANNKQCDIPDCLVSCTSQACQYLGYVNDGSCSHSTYDECQVAGSDLCILSDSSCMKKGFVQKSGTTDCEYPTNCSSGSQTCSPICLHLNYQSGASSCNLPVDQSACLLNNDDYCLHDQRACKVLGWAKNSGDGKCKIPDCLGSISQCSQSVCSYLGYDKNADSSCKQPSIADCFETNKNRCANSLSFCLSYGFIKSATSNDCEVPDCMSNLLLCQNSLCTYLGYLNDGSNCKLPTFVQCQEISNNRCIHDQQAACVKVGFIKQSGNYDCQFPSNCLSNSQSCSNVCLYLNYITNGSACEHLDYASCLTSNKDYCSIPDRSCRVYGWDKNSGDDSCKQPDCLNSSISCQKNACQLLQYIKQNDNTCKIPTVEECMETGKNRCHNALNQCIQKGLVKDSSSENCTFPTDCQTQTNCSEACVYLGYIKKFDNSCGFPTHYSCLITGQSQCSLPLKACSALGWDKTSDGLSCQYPNCTIDISTCSKQACDYLGYIKQADNSCLEPTIDECVQNNQNRCQHSNRFCVFKYYFLLGANGNCDAPTDCETRIDKCPGACNYIGYVQDSSNPSLICKKPVMEDCYNQNNPYLCRAAVTFCSDYGWIKSLTPGLYFCVLPNCMNGQRCGPLQSSTACLYSGFVKSPNNDSCIKPNDEQCKTFAGLCINPYTVCSKRGWENAGNGDCKSPSNCLQVGGSYCAQGKTVCTYTGYVKSSSNDDCIQPTMEHCTDKNNAFLCKNDILTCTSIGFIQTSEVGKYYCEFPTDCKTDINACEESRVACKIKGFVKDKTTNKCVVPQDEDCFDQSNLYACFDQTEGYCAKQNWKRTSAPNKYYCVPPSDCTINNQCQLQYTACQYIGYVNDYTNNNCIVPTNEHCQNTVFLNLCRPGVTFCTDKGYLKKPDSNKCAIPDCLSGHYCQSGFTACTFNGYIDLADGTCRTPENADCMASSASKFPLLCRYDITFCTSLGYKRSIVNPSDNFCVSPTDCKDSLQCANGLTACITQGYKKGVNNDVCYEPSDFDCFDSTANPDLCKSGITFCTDRGWLKNSIANFCEPPTNCTVGNQCTSGKTACLFLGYVGNGSGKCITPNDVECAKDSNPYLCRNGNTFCTDKGWRKIDIAIHHYCVAPSDDECLNGQLCSPLLEACKYKGFVNNGADDGCMQPTDEQCFDPTNYPFLCRPDIYFCTGIGYVKDSSSNKCVAPTDCLGKLKCGGTITACIYTGFLPTASNDYTCKKPVQADCLIKSNLYLCRDPSYDCVNTFKYVKTSDLGFNYCELPSQCLTNSSSCSSNSVCLTLGYVKKVSNNDCKIPSDANCQDSTNTEACGDQATFCKKIGWVKTSDSGKNFCVAPADCMSGNQCSSTLSACKYIGYVKSSAASNQCSVPTDEQCLNPAVNMNLCRPGVGFCSDKGWLKNPADNSCIKPTDCLTGEQCGMGKICLFLGYVKEKDSNKCKIPLDEDCNDRNNNYACRPGNTFCVSRGWIKTSDPLLNHCVPDVDCLLGNQCDPSLHLCRFLGYVQIPSSLKCRIPTDSDCEDQSNDMACRTSSSFCTLKGWNKSIKPTENFCVAPQCLDGQGHCSSTLTACKYFGYVKNELDDQCRIPDDEDCIIQSNNLCDPKIKFCTNKGFLKVSDPSKMYCVLPSDCTTGNQCSSQLTACRNIGGYVQSKNGENCVLPDDDDCMNTSLTLCRTGVDICTNRGFVKSTSRTSDRFCIIPECLTIPDLCNPSLTACQFGGFLKSQGNNNCKTPTDEECANPNNKYLCRVGNVSCPSRGWARNTSTPIDKSCITPPNCLSSNFLCGDQYTACTLSGYVKNPLNNLNTCLVPSTEQCLDQTQNLCKYPTSPCIAIKGFKQASNGNYCVYPDNCLQGISCSPSQVACSNLGYVKTSDSFFKCMLPTDAQCLTQKLCNSDQSLCIQKGFKKNGENCVAPDDCLTGLKCGSSLTACIHLGYVKNQSDDSCKVPTFDDCLNNVQANLCSENVTFCKKYGFIADSLKKCTIKPEICADSNYNLCQDEIKYCTDLGWKKSNQIGKCEAPAACLNQEQCSVDKSACRIIGYISNQKGLCETPTNCKIGKQCSSFNIVCVNQGFTRNITDDTCICKDKVDESGKCIKAVESSQTSASVVTFNLIATLLTLFIFI